MDFVEIKKWPGGPTRSKKVSNLIPMDLTEAYDMVVGRYGQLKYGIYGQNGREQRILLKRHRNPGRIGDFGGRFLSK